MAERNNPDEVAAAMVTGSHATHLAYVSGTPEQKDSTSYPRTELTDAQIVRCLDALTRPLYNWRMARAKLSYGNKGAQKTYRRALMEIRALLQDPAGQPDRIKAAEFALLEVETLRPQAKQEHKLRKVRLDHVRWGWAKEPNDA